MIPIKFFTGRTFDNKGFADMLNNIGVIARAVDDGIFIDILAFNAIRPGVLPHWAYINRQGINSPLRTRPATEEELKGNEKD